MKYYVNKFPSPREAWAVSYRKHSNSKLTDKILIPSPPEALGVSYKGGKNMGLDMYLFPSPREA